MKLRTIAWYQQAEAILGTHTQQSTADQMYFITNDDSISAMQCSKWAKGQRCSAKWINRLNKQLPSQIGEMYEHGPNGVPLWLAFDLPSLAKSDDLLFLSLKETNPPPLLRLAFAVTAFYHAAELFVLDAAAAAVEVSARGFFDVDDEYYKNQANHGRKLMERVKSTNCKMITATKNCADEFTPAEFIPQIAIQHFIFSSKKHHPKNVDAKYLLKFINVA